MRLRLEQQVTDFDLSCELSDLLGGIPVGVYSWKYYESDGHKELMQFPGSWSGVEMDVHKSAVGPTFIPAFTVPELAAIIPKKTMLLQHTSFGRWWRQTSLEIAWLEEASKWLVRYVNPNSRQTLKSFSDARMENAMGEMVVFLLKEDLIPKP